MSWFGKSEGEIARDDHNRGEQDASKGICNPPGDPISDFLGCFIPGLDSDKAREDYMSGQDNTNDQKK